MVFEKTNVNLQTRYVCKQWNIGSNVINFIEWEDITSSIVSVDINKNGHEKQWS